MFGILVGLACLVELSQKSQYRIQRKAHWSNRLARSTGTDLSLQKILLLANIGQQRIECVKVGSSLELVI